MELDTIITIVVVVAVVAVIGALIYFIYKGFQGLGSIFGNLGSSFNNFVGGVGAGVNKFFYDNFPNAQKTGQDIANAAQGTQDTTVDPLGAWDVLGLYKVNITPPQSPVGFGYQGPNAQQLAQTPATAAFTGKIGTVLSLYQDNGAQQNQAPSVPWDAQATGNYTPMVQPPPVYGAHGPISHGLRLP